MVFIGTSGFQYPEWKGKFYPKDLSARGMLRFYSERFNTTEINYTFRRIPSEGTIKKWEEEAPASFKFSFKAPQRISHFARLKNCGDILSAFLTALVPAREKTGFVLIQLPPNFKKDAELLKEFLAALPKQPVFAFEFRHESWFDDEIFSSLHRYNAALCIAENEEFVTPRVSTGTSGYLRLRREDYTPAKLKWWARFIREQTHWRDVFIYFKHEDQAVGPKFAAQFAKFFDAD